MSQRVMNICATIIALALGGMAEAQTTGATDTSSTPSSASTTTLTSPGQVRVADKFAAPFTTMAGSRENAVALASALRTGSPATLTYTTTASDGTLTTTTTTITPPTKPMGWGNVSHSLALAQFALAQQGISNPTGPQLQAALVGGTFTTADGKSVTMADVLQQRADGMGWGRIAQSYGTTMGAVNRTIKTPTTTAVVSSTGTAATVTTAKTASGQSVAPARGLTTAGGTQAGAGQGTKGITTAAGATGGTNQSGIVSADGSAHGNGNAYGRGVVTASGSGAGSASGVGPNSAASKGIVTGAGNASGVVTADPSHGGGTGSAHGKGKGGG